MKKTCLKCDKMAVWQYAPGTEHMAYCDDCIGRDCSCNYDLDEDCNYLDTQPVGLNGRTFPCCEYDYSESGFDEQFNCPSTNGD